MAPQDSPTSAGVAPEDQFFVRIPDFNLGGLIDSPNLNFPGMLGFAGFDVLNGLVDMDINVDLSFIADDDCHDPVFKINFH